MAFQKGGKPGPGRPKGRLNKQTEQAREFARGILASPQYRASLKARADEGRLAPAVETLLWHYAHGKPPDKVEVTGADAGPLQVIFGGRYKDAA